MKAMTTLEEYANLKRIEELSDELERRANDSPYLFHEQRGGGGPFKNVIKQAAWLSNKATDARMAFFKRHAEEIKAAIETEKE